MKENLMALIYAIAGLLYLWAITYMAFGMA